MRTKKPLLWIWRGVLTDYTSGVAFAIAHTAEEAVDAVRKSGDVISEDHFYGTKIDGVEPTSHEAPYGGAEYGGS